jgi:hypothetical protein
LSEENVKLYGEIEELKEEKSRMNKECDGRIL